MKLTPQEKKRLSLAKDCRNAYGENDKSSRKAIRKNKRRVNQSYRRSVRQALVDDMADSEQVGVDVSSVKRSDWKKFPDVPLGEHLDMMVYRGLEGRIWLTAQRIEGFAKRFEAMILDSELEQKEQEIVIRQMKAVALDSNSSSLKLSSTSSTILTRLLEQITNE